MPLSTYASNKMIDHFTGKTAYTMPVVYVGLSSTTPSLTGTGVTEPSTGSYTRIATSGATWNSSASGSTNNASAITFTQASADWLSGANLTYGLLYDAASGGNFLGYGALSVPKNCLSGDTIVIPANSLTVTFN